MAGKPNGGSITDRWASEIPEQFKDYKMTPEEKKEIEEFIKRTQNEKFREYVNR